MENNRRTAEFDDEQHRHSSIGLLWRSGKLYLRSSGLWLLTVVLVVALIAGMHFSLGDNDNEIMLGLLLVLLVALMAWKRDWWAGVLAGFFADALIAPYSHGHHSMMIPSLTPSIWLQLCLCYPLVGGMVGLRGSSFRHLQRANEELALLSTIATAVTRSLELSTVEVNALAQIGNLLSPDVIQLYELNAVDQTFELKTARPTLPELAARTLSGIPANEGIFGVVCKSQRVELFSALQSNLKLAPPTIPPQITNLLAVPLCSHNHVIAVMLLGRKASLQFTPDDEKFLESIGRALSVAIENAKLVQQLQTMSFSDELTGLGNRRMFNLRLGMEADRVALSGAPLCLVTFDLDHFKQVNDKYGHPTGDNVLREFARRVQEQIRTTDLFCRVGGEEFALVAPDTSLSTTLTIAERICRSISNPPFLFEGGTPILMTVSAGIATLQPPLYSVDALMAAADQALYAAKAAGRNRVEVFHGDTVPLPKPPTEPVNTP